MQDEPLQPQKLQKRRRPLGQPRDQRPQPKRGNEMTSSLAAVFWFMVMILKGLEVGRFEGSLLASTYDDALSQINEKHHRL